MALFKNKRKIIFLILYFILAIVAMLCPYSETINKVIAVFVLVFSVLLIYQTRNSIALLLISIFIGYSNYSVVVGIYLCPDMRPSALYPQITDVKVYGVGIMMVLLLMIALVALLPNKKEKVNDSVGKYFVLKENYNPFIFSAMAVCFLFCIFYGYSWSSSGRGESSSLYEYAIIFLILMFYYRGGNSILKYISFLMAAIYIMTSLLNGTRVEALECGFVIILCMSQKRIPRKWICIGGFLAVVAFSLVGSFRGDYSDFFGLAASVFKEFTSSKLVFDTCTHAYFPALCMIEKFLNYDVQTAWHFFSRFVLSVFVGQSDVTDGNLISYIREFYYHNYGGYLTGFVFVWFSYFGSLIVAWLVTRYTKVLQSNRSLEKSPYKLCALIYLSTTVPRWYLYGPWPLLRGMAICLIVFWLAKRADTIVRYVWKQRKNLSDSK